MKNTLLLFIAFSWASFLQAQYLQLRMQEDYTVEVERMSGTLPGNTARNNFDQLPGFPKSTLALPANKNLRNVTLADLTGNGVDEILFAAGHKLFAFSADTLLWEKNLIGGAMYPPSVADVDNDGLLDIVQTTGGVNESGRLYLLDRDGTDFPNWPLNFNDHWMLSAATLSDLDNDNQLEIIVGELVAPAGNVYILQVDGSPFNNNWPVDLDGPPAITPSVGDIDNDGEKDIVVFSTRSRYIFNLDGTPKPGFPIYTYPDQRYSFQSPLLVDFDGDQQYEIVGAAHGDAPFYYILNSDGSFRNGWPIDVPGSSWTYSTPSVVELDGNLQVFMGRRSAGGASIPALFSWDVDGSMQNGFPMTRTVGWEGLISIADIDDDDEFELLFGGDIMDTLGYGFLYAYELDGLIPVDGFPIRMRGSTMLNGANLGDVNNDGMLDLIALSYTLNLGASPDSSYLNVYDLGVPYVPEKILWSTYKGGNTRTGLIGEELISDVTVSSLAKPMNVALYPNPSKNVANLALQLEQMERVDIQVLNHLGQIVYTVPQQELRAGAHQFQVPLNNLPTGLYWININSFENQISKKLIKY